MSLFCFFSINIINFFNLLRYCFLLTLLNKQRLNSSLLINHQKQRRGNINNLYCEAGEAENLSIENLSKVEIALLVAVVSFWEILFGAPSLIARGIKKFAPRQSCTPARLHTQALAVIFSKFSLEFIPLEC